MPKNENFGKFRIFFVCTIFFIRQMVNALKALENLKKIDFFQKIEKNCSKYAFFQIFNFSSAFRALTICRMKKIELTKKF